MALRAMLAAADAVGEDVRCKTKARLAAALLALAKVGDEAWHQDEALTVVRDAQADADRCLKPPQRAMVDDELATVLHAIGTTRADSDMTTEAGAMKRAVLEHYKAIGQTKSAERLLAELAAMTATARPTGGVSQGVAA